MIKRFLLFIVNVFLISVTLFAQIPAGYYDSAAGKTGTTLQQALHDIISPHTSVSYTPGVWNSFQTTDVRPSPNNTKIWDMYSDIPSGTPVYEYTVSTNQCGTYSGEGSCYNREHSFPKSWFGAASPMVTDLHHIFATDGYVNNKRGNYPYGEVSSPTWTSTNGSKLGPCSYPGYTGTVFEPIDEYKGDFARAYFYMATRYYGEDSGWPGSDMVNGSQPKPWALNMLKEWSANDPVSTKEIDRNNAIYQIQGNRNPFIDHPEYVGEIWGTTAPSITNIANSPSNPTSSDQVSVSSDITDDGTISSATLKWCTDGSSFGNSINMSVSSGDTYTTDSNIPAQANGTTVSYKIEATDNDSKTSTSSIKEYTIGTVNTPPNISNITISPSSPTSADVVSVTSDITDDGTISSASVKWCTDGSSFNNTINMTLTSGSTYKADSDIPAQVNGTTVSYKITATDNNSSTSTSPINTYTIGASSSTYETFDNFTVTGSSYADGTFTGQDGSTWTYTKCRGDVPINGATPCLAKDATAKVQSGTISGGCGTLSFDFKKAFSTDVALDVYVNSTKVTTITSSSTSVENTGNISVNVVGDFTLKFIQSSGSAGQVCIDNISWTSYSGSGNTIETFDNCTVGASYADGNFVGVNGITWNYVQSRNEDAYGIDGNGLILRDATNSSKCYSQTITSGIGNFSVQLKKAFTGAGNRQVELFINNVSYGTSSLFDDTDTHTFTVNDINISGNVVIDIRNITSYQVLVDNISWTDYTGSGGAGCANDLIISEYVEGSTGTNKYIEIYNGTSGNVDLSNYDIVIYHNGSSSPSSPISLNSVTLNQGDVYVLANSSSTAWSGTPDQTSGNLDFNGNDVVALRKNSTNIDVIGTIGSSDDFAQDEQLQRKSSVTAPTTTYNTDEWNISADSYNDLGEHVMTCCTCPTTQASNFSSSSVTSKSMTISWTRGNGNKVIVLAHEGSTVDKDPSSGSTYTANSSFSSGDEIGSGNYVVYNGTSTSVNITNLSPLTTYYFAVYEYNTADNCYNQTELTGNETTLAVPEPTNYPTNFAVSSKTHQLIQLTWTDATAGTGETAPEKYLIKMSNVSFADITDPVDGTAEADGSTTKNISQGTGSCSFTGLTESTTYYFKIYPYTNSGTNIDYKIGSEPQVSETTDAAPAGGCADDLIISEYVEGSGSNKYIEIFNGTGSSVDLSDYKLRLYANGALTPNNDVQLSGTLNDGQTIVYENSSATAYTGSATANAACNFNGDDALALYKVSTTSNVDIFGCIGEDPGSAWTSGSYTTVNKTLVRKSDVTSGVTTNPSSGFPTLSTEWDMYNQDDVSHLGSHTMTCGPVSPPTTQASNITFTDVTTGSFTINWTNGDGDGRIVKINTNPTIADPVDGSDPTANTSYNSGGGQQVVYNGSSNSVSVTNLSSNTQYFVKVFEKNGTGSSISYLTSNAPDNNQITPNMSSQETTIAIQDFESTPATPTLNYTTTVGSYVSISGNSGSGDRPASTACYLSSNTSWRTKNTTVTNSFNNIDISSYQDVYIEVWLGAFSIGSSANGMDGTDYVNFEVSTDNGTSWSSEVKITGNSNACWSFSATGEANITYDGDNTPSQYQPAGGGLRTTDGYSKIKISIPNSNNQVKLRITAVDNSSNESWLIDDVKIIGSQSSTSANTDNFRSCTNGGYNTQATWQSSADSTNWYAATLIPDQNASSIVISNYNTVSLSADLTVKDFKISNDGSFSMGADNHTITMYGNLDIVSGGTLDLSQNGTLLKCSGTNAQDISGDGTISLYNFEINKTSGNVTLSRDVTINNNLTLTKGNIITGSNILTVDNDATNAISGYGVSSYVNSNLKRKISTSGGSYDFPVGSDYYELANINFNSITSSATPYIKIMFNKTITGNVPNIIFSGTPIKELLNSGFWTITPTDVSTVNYDVSLSSRGQTNGGSSTGQHIHLKRDNAISDWKASDGTPGTSTGTGTDPITVVKTGLTSFSDHAIGKGTYPLPIELIGFNAKVVNNNIELSWQTSSEINNDYFTVERSKDAIHFELVDIIQGNGNSNKTIKYKAIDYSPYQGISYYRLKQTDYDGKFNYSKIVSVNNVKSYDFSIKKLFVDKDNILHLNIFNPNNEQFNIEIFDMMGIVVLQREYSPFDNQIVFNFTTKQLSHGIYNIIIYNSKVRFNKKIIVE